jgi:hypothetical protein
MELEQQFAHAVARYDRRSAGRKGYNPYALGLYLIKAEECAKAVEGGKPLRQAIDDCFGDRLRLHLLKWFNLGE